MTDKGVELVPILLALMQWGDRHKADPEGPPVIARHAGCGEDLRVTLACTKGHEVADARRHRAGGRARRAAARPGLR